jgi:hypothetical protein
MTADEIARPPGMPSSRNDGWPPSTMRRYCAHFGSIIMVHLQEEHEKTLVLFSDSGKTLRQQQQVTEFIWHQVLFML